MLRDLARFARPYPWALPSLVFLGLFASLAEGFGIGLLIPLLAALSLMIVALIGVKTLVHAVDLKVATAWVGRVARDLRVAASRQLLHVGYSWFARSEQGYLLNVLDTQTYRASDGLLWLATTITNLCTVVVFLALLSVLSWQLALVEHGQVERLLRSGGP
ncbi:MAG TPA: ABC transporter transmembrane domain-containing protein [Burkholderiales bacterium]|nr:ABC transporter transmembrane domain-containing protein [Burkholderiales bacterium]